MKAIRAIETHYKGYRFRSRLEARWAVFFDALGISWEYEAEGFVTSAGPYLPDFRLFGSLYVEIKPASPISIGIQDAFPKIAAFANTGRDITTLFGDPQVRWYPVLTLTRMSSDDRDLNLLSIDWLDFGMSASKQRPWYYYGGVEMPPQSHLSYNDTLAGAVWAARGARFEHGETPG